MKTWGVYCARNGCIALAAPESVYCAVHRVWETVDRVLGLVPPVRPVNDAQIERDREGQPVRFYPRGRR